MFSEEWEMVMGALDLGDRSYCHKCFYDDAKVLQGKESASPILASWFLKRVAIQSTTEPERSLYLNWFDNQVPMIQQQWHHHLRLLDLTQNPFLLMGDLVCDWIQPQFTCLLYHQVIKRIMSASSIDEQTRKEWAEMKFLGGQGNMSWGAKHAKSVSVFGVGNCNTLNVIWIQKLAQFSPFNNHIKLCFKCTISFFFNWITSNFYK